MRTLLLVIFCLLWYVSSSFAQFQAHRKLIKRKNSGKDAYFGIRAGGGYSDWYGELVAYSDTDNRYRPLLVGSAGIVGGFNFHRYFGVSAEVNYLMHRIEYQSASESDLLKMRTQRQFVEVPILFYLTMFQPDRRIRPYFYGGPSFSYMLDATQSMVHYDLATAQPKGARIASDVSGLHETLNYGVLSGVGVKFAISRVVALKVDVRHYLGLSRVYKEKELQTRDYMLSGNIGLVFTNLTNFEKQRYFQ
ncbi:porin family protein [Rapidithrix thailandica]|uniref:Porin family protein n=1 Tax=Rapidithrix thailandica TaxID=413964 RepID=A0AAW9SH02_9BACT